MLTKRFGIRSHPEYVQSLLEESSVSGRHRVNDLLVERPRDSPVEVDNVLGRTLRDDELLQSLNSHTATADTPDGRHARIVPTGDEALVNEPSELTLGEERLDEIEPRKVPDVDLAKAESLEHPPVLGVTVTVLDGSESMSDTLEAIDERAGEVVGRVGLVLVAGAVVGSGVAAEDDGVAHGLVRVVDGNLRAEAVLDTLRTG